MTRYLTIGELFMVFAGIGLLVSLPFLWMDSMTLWLTAKGVYIAGLVIMIVFREWK